MLCKHFHELCRRHPLEYHNDLRISYFTSENVWKPIMYVWYRIIFIRYSTAWWTLMKQILNSSYVGYVHRITVSLFTFIKYMTVIFHAFEQSWNFLAWVVKFFIFIIFCEWRCDCGCSEGSIFELQSNAIHFWLQNISS